MAHLFNYVGAPLLTQKRIRKVKEAYGDITPYYGYNDDEDQGQMGALRVLMAMGLFEVEGGSAAKPCYEIASPLFNEITIQLNTDYYLGKKFVIKTKNNQTEDSYIQSAKLNGKSWDNRWFYHSLFEKGGTTINETLVTK